MSNIKNTFTTYLYYYNFYPILLLGTDGYQADSIVVYTDPATNYECTFSTFLDGETSEIGHNCSPFWFNNCLDVTFIIPKLMLFLKYNIKR